MIRRARLGTVLGMAVLTAATLSVPSTAQAYDSSSGSGSSTAGNCVAYATGTSMGSYCLGGGGGGTPQTLRERFAGQDFDRCRFSPVPSSMTKPFNPAPDEGEWLVRSCINYIDFDTVDGGEERQFNIHLAWVPNTVDTATPQPETGLSQFLWNQAQTSTQFPVPFLEAEPTPVPRVGVPAYVTFRWVSPDDQQVVSQGPWSGRDGGGPFIQVENPNGLLMRARAIRLVLDPLQRDMPLTECSDVNPTYDTAAGPDPDAQASDCFVYYTRSSVSARERMRETKRKPPESLGDVYVLRVQVYWEAEYSDDGGASWTPIGRGTGPNAQRDLVQVTDQPLPVREAQAVAVPPRISLR